MSELHRDQHKERARLLLQQRRYKDAETQAGIALQQNPNDAEALQIIGHCKLDTKQTDEALKLFQQCIGLEPDDDYVHYLIAFCYYRKDDIDTAKKFVEQAIALFPRNAGYFALLSNIFFSKRNYADALNAANKGLYENPEDIGCLNARSAALFRLNKKDEAYDTINEALQVNPEDAFTHTNYGWHYLEKGKHKNAVEHFREALRINPNSHSAKEGYKNALKSKLPFYRWILQYSLWMNHQNRSVRIAMIFGLWIVVRLVASFSDSEQQWLRYVAGGITLLYLLFVMLSWLGSSLANLFLLMSPHGKLALTDSERMSAKAVGLSLLAGIAALACGISLDRKFYYIGFLICSLAIPLSYIDFPIRWFKGEGRQITAHILIPLCLVTCVMVFFNDQLALFAGIIYFIFFVGYMWSGSISAIRRK
ncbi:MAG TPA: tetratricopeptide repeat protein [Panacibacter sp.]|nr:tetratricopeptide repeat protein [Panacibacter sp.]HNP45974.1 tetratricopeptide repeat protein [Panacibacter sp.]